MLHLRRSEARGVGEQSWLTSRYAFSFAGYFDPQQMGFRSLRVFNEDRIEGGSCFEEHSHRDMEIISYVVKGALGHEDSMGNKTVILPGEIQRLSTGTGITHSECNKLEDEETHFFQIWITPQAKGGTPSYGQRSFEAQLAHEKLVLAVSPDGRDGSIEIKQDVDLYISRLKPQDGFEFSIRPDRGVWIQLVKGRMTVNDEELNVGDALEVSQESAVNFHALEESEFMLFDLA